MRPDERLQDVVDRMSPGVLCRDGFLGSDARSLAEIVDADNSAVAALGTSHGRIAAAMRRVLDEAMAACGAPVKIGSDMVAVYRESMGRIPCPFGGGKLFPKGEVELIGTDTRNGESVIFTPLGVHLVGEHGFYQGLGSRYRVQPEKLAGLLGLRDD